MILTAKGDLIRRRAIEIELERRKRAKAKEEADRARAELPPVPFGEWLKVHRTEFRWDGRHFVAMQSVLDRVTAGEVLRAYFSIPIRHGKSEHNTISYAVYRLMEDPTTRILVVSYNQRQANKFSREIRKLARKVGVILSREVAGVEEWETQEGGGVRAVGISVGVASVNADLIIIDDPFSSREDAESQAVRDAVWEALTSDILARTEPTTAVLFTMSRWHQDDAAGRLLERMRDGWSITDLPGEAEANDPLDRAVGEALWPEERGKVWLDQKRIELLAYGFASLIQGRPRPREGGMFKWEWWQDVAAFPTAGPVVRYWDMAGTKQKRAGHDPDYTAGALLGRTPEKCSVVGHVTRFRLDVAARDPRIAEQAKKDQAIYGGRLVYWFERQAGIGGAEASDSLIRSIQALGIAVYSEIATGDKLERARPLASAAMAGNVFLAPDDPIDPWHNDFKLEAADFGPSARHDDQIDAAGAAHNKLELAASQTAGTFYFPR